MRPLPGRGRQRRTDRVDQAGVRVGGDQPDPAGRGEAPCDQVAETYGVEIEASQDDALILAIVVCIDAMTRG